MVIITAFVGLPWDGSTVGAEAPCDDWRASVVSGGPPRATTGAAPAGTGTPASGLGRIDAPTATRRLRRPQFVDK